MLIVIVRKGTEVQCRGERRAFLLTSHKKSVCCYCVIVIMRLCFPKTEDCDVEGRIWTPSFARSSVALACGEGGIVETVSSAGVVISSMHGMHDGYLGMVQGKGIRSATVCQEIIGKLMAGDFVGLGGGFHMDRNLTCRNFVFFKACLAYGEGGRC